MSTEPDNAIDDGGAAFPRGVDQFWCVQNGMTLRDYFAGQALAGMLANSSLCYWRSENGIEIDKFRGREALALKSYQAADAMMTARAQ